ncbi:hypothetical protein [Paenibacillus sp. SI8]|uniref:hypothetical protein n=1 Tax=unclassified Paenibacillus TaxID=185978 RepID=UPI0034664CBD
MSLINDIQSVELFVKSVHPTAIIEKQTAPLKPTANTFVIRFLSDSTESETRFHTRTDREYQFLCYGQSAQEVLAKMDMLRKALYQTLLIPIKDSLRYIRVESFSLSQPLKTDNELFAMVGVLSTQIREARTQEQYDKMTQIHLRIL